MVSKQQEALTRLTRLCQTNPDNIGHLRNVLGTYLASCAFPAVAVAQETGDPIGAILAECLSECDDHGLLLDIYEALPANTVSLREVHAVISQRMVETAKTDHPDDWELLAETTGAYAAALADLGERQQALGYAQESACLYQRRATGLSANALQSLFSLAECYMNVGQMDDTLLLQTEVVAGYRALYDSDPARYVTQYTNVLLVMSSYYKMQERLSEAIDCGAKADYFIKQIANPALEHIYLQHRIINHLAECYEQIDQLEIAADLLRDNMMIVRDLDNHATDRYGLELTDTLETLATIESRLGNKQAAETAAAEAIQRLSNLYHYRPQAFASHYVNLLTNMGLVDLTFENLDSAQQRMDKATAILEPLYQQFPARFAPNLAAVLNNRVEIHLALFRHEDALHDAHRSLCLYRSFAGQDANVAMALNTLGNARMQSGDLFRAQRSISACIKLYRRLADWDEVFRTDLAITLGTLAALHEQVEDYPAALASANEALDYWNNSPTYLKEAHPHAFHQVAKVRFACLIEMEQYDEALECGEALFAHTDQYEHLGVQRMADALNLYADLLSRIDRHAEAVEVAQQAIAYLRSLPIDEIPAYKVDLADSLTNLGFLQVMEAPQQALASVSEAVQLYNELPEPLTEQMRTNQALALQNQAELLKLNHRTENGSDGR